MSNLAVIQKSPIEEFLNDVLPADRLEDLSRSLPAHIKPAVFQRNLLNALMTNPDLMNHSPGLVFREVSKAAGLGLLLDPQLGETYIIVGYNYKTRRQEPQLRIGYKGLTKLARQSGAVSLIYAHEVHANDFVDCDLGADKRLVHKPKLFTDRGEIIGYYAVIKFRDGEFDFEPMDVPEIRRIRDRTDAYQAFKSDKIKSTPWATDEAEMAKKTVIRRLMKRAPQSPEMAEALQIEDSADYAVTSRPTALSGPGPRRAPPPPPPPQLVSAPVLPEPMADDAGAGAPPPAPASEAIRRAPPPPQVTSPAAKPDTSAALTAYADALKAAQGMTDRDAALDAIETAWAEHIEPPLTANQMSQEDYEAASALDNAAREAIAP